MKALIKYKPENNKEWHRGLALVDKPEPVIEKPNEVKIKVLAAGICGTDVSIYKGTQALKDSMAALKDSNVIVGHEFCGQIEELGSSAKKHVATMLYNSNFRNENIARFLKKYDSNSLVNSDELLPFLIEYFYVTAEMHITCGNCYQCQQNEGHVCRNTIIKGLHQNGSFAKFLVVPAQSLVLLEKGEIPLQVVSFMDAIGNAVHAVQSAKVKGGSTLILGLGIQGLMAIAIAKKMGAAKIFATDISESKFSLAKNLGADYCFNVASPHGKEILFQTIQQKTNETGVDTALEMSGYYPAFEDAFKNVRNGGTVALLGLPSGTISFDFSKNVIFRGITIKGVIGRRIFDTWDTMHELLRAKDGLSKIILENNIISHDLPLEKYEEGFQALISGNAIKVILRP